MKPKHLQIVSSSKGTSYTYIVDKSQDLKQCLAQFT